MDSTEPSTTETIHVAVTVDTDELRRWADIHADRGNHGVAHVLYKAAADGESLSEQAIAEAEKRGAEKAKDPRWDTAVDWLLNHSAVVTDWAPLFFAYYDGLITEKELREEVSCEPADTDEDGLPVGIHAVVNKRRAAAEAGQPA